MKDIKSLFEAAKNSGTENDILSYTEAIQESLKTPADYISNIEYIISSNIGLGTYKEFAKAYGTSIPMHDKVSALVEECANRLGRFGVENNEYNAVLESLNEFRKKYAACFAMYEYYAPEDVRDYNRAYYAFNENGVQQSRLLAGMVKAYGEAAIADAIIVADRISPAAVDAVLEYVIKKDDRVLNEWTYMCAKDMTCSTDKLNALKENSVSSVVESMNARHLKQFRESVIANNNEAEYDYTESEISAIKDLIALKEYTLTCADELGLNSIKEYKEIGNLYEELDGIVFESDDRLDDFKDELVPIYGVVKSYSEGNMRSDGMEKDKDDILSAKMKKAMKVITNGDVYAHACLSFDPNMKKLYSYEGYGFVTDTIDNTNWTSTDSIYFCVMFIPKTDADNIKKYIEEMEKDPSKTKFAFMNIIKNQVGTPTKVDNRFVCAAFVSKCLAYADPKNLHRDYSRIRPDDVTILPRAFYVMTVRDRFEFNARKDEFKQRVDNIFSTHKDEIEDYNNMLPRIMLKDRMDKLKTIDKITDWFMTKLNVSRPAAKIEVESASDDSEDD